VPYHKTYIDNDFDAFSIISDSTENRNSQVQHTIKITEPYRRENLTTKENTPAKDRIRITEPYNAKT
jgi:hypothetical protein